VSGLKLVIGNHNYSSWSLRPWLMLRFHDIPFECQRVSLFVETMGTELAPYFSDGKVPVLLDGDDQVWDSLAILEYLAERLPAIEGWPADRRARAVARSVSAEMHSSFPALRSELPMNCRRRFPGFEPSPDAQRDIDRVLAVWRFCRDRFGAAGPWLFGRFSVADCMYAPVVMRFVSYEVKLDPASRAYVETLSRCPAMAEWVELARAEPEVIEEDEAPWPSEPR
jgi:glutathione S-transferase